MGVRGRVMGCILIKFQEKCIMRDLHFSFIMLWYLIFFLKILFIQFQIGHMC